MSPNLPPQDHQGHEVLALTIVPQYATSRLLVEVTGYASEINNNTEAIIAALFRDGLHGAIAAGWADLGFEYVFVNASNTYSDSAYSLRIMVPAMATIPTTFRLRLGTDTGQAFGINGRVGGLEYLGGTLRTTLTVTEIRG